MKRFLTLALLMALIIPAAAQARTPSDTLLSQQWYLNQLRAFDAWDTETGSRDIVVAVLDTGVDLDHIDLEENVWANAGEIPGDGIDNDGNGFVDDVHGWDFVDDDADASPVVPQDADLGAVAHGTVIAGAIGAVGNNNEGIAGINWNVRIMPVRMLDAEGSGLTGNALSAVRYAVDNGADVINLSFTGVELHTAFQDEVERAYEQGVTVVAAVGNDSNGGTNVNAQPIYPACFASSAGDPVIGVAATDESDEKTEFSNYGSDCTDLAAPGVSIFSTSYHDSTDPQFSEPYRGGWAGTSIASPMVAGAAALLRAQYPGITPDEVKTALQLSVDPVKDEGTPWAGHMGAGRLNIDRALETAADIAGPAPEETEEPAQEPVSATPGSKLVAVATEGGNPPFVRIFNDRGELLHRFLAYDEGFTGGVRVAMADVDRDGFPEVVTAPGAGMESVVRIYEVNGELIREFRAFDRDLQVGFYVSSGDVNRDGVPDIAVSSDAGGTGEVRVFKPDGRYLAAFRPFGETDRSVRAAVADIEGDGIARIVFVLGDGAAPRVRVHDASGIPLDEFLAYAPTFTHGIFVAAGDTDGDGKDEIVTSPDVGGGPHVRVFEGDGEARASFFAYDPAFRGGARIGVGNLDGASASIVTSAGPGGGPHVRVFNGGGTAIGGFFSDDETDREGINVAVWNR